MNPVAKLGAFGLLLVAVLGGGALVGRAVGPVDTEATPEHDDDHAEGTDGAGSVAQGTGDRLPAGGLLVSQDGYALVPSARELAGGPFSFRITGPDGEAVTAYDELHDRELHLIVAGRDLREYAHVHPTRAADGTWTVELPAFAGGAYRAFADFRPSGHDQLTLGVDLHAPGALATEPGIVPTDHDHVAGLDVSLEVEGATATITARRDGRVVTTEPYLGAAGHLVALRDGDLAYLHVHPLDEVPAGPVAFAVEYPSAGRYALFFDFQVDGTVHTARFVVDAGADGTAAPGDDDHGGH